MKSLFTLILTSSFLLTACGKDSKSNSSSPAPAKPVVVADKDADKLTHSSDADKGKKTPTAPILEKLADVTSGPSPTDSKLTPKEVSTQETAKKPETMTDSVASVISTKVSAPAVPLTPAQAAKTKEVKATSAPVKAAPVVAAKAPKHHHTLPSHAHTSKPAPQAPPPPPPPPPRAQAPQAPAPRAQAPQATAPQDGAPCVVSCANVKSSQPEFSGLEVTGLAATHDQSYITLVNDGLMTAIKREMTRGNMEEVRANSMLAQSLVNGRMFIDPATGDRLVTVKVLENSHVQTYNYRVTGYTNRMKSMKLVPLGPYSRTTGYQDMNASLACMDTCGKCDVAILKLETMHGAEAKAYAILRNSTTDLKFRMNHPESQNPDVSSIRNFFVNSDLQSRTSNRVDNAKVETFEVAYGVSMVRTIIMGLNGEMFSQVAPLVHSTQGALNMKMRLADRNPQDLDIADLENRSTFLSAKVALATLAQVDGNGSLTVNYMTPRSSSASAGEGFYVKFKARVTPVFPMTGALLM